MAASLLSVSRVCVFAVDSDSEHSQSCLELNLSLEEGNESRSECYHSVPSCLTGGKMSQEDWHGDEEEEDEGAKSNGAKKHR